MLVRARKKGTRGIFLGPCPLCGDEVYWYKAKGSRGRYCRCVNSACKFSGPLPRKGRLEVTGVVCGTYPGILISIDYNATDNPADARHYFWQTGPDARPCATCRTLGSCAAVKEVLEELEDNITEEGLPW